MLWHTHSPMDFQKCQPQIQVDFCLKQVILNSLLSVFSIVPVKVTLEQGHSGHQGTDPFLMHLCHHTPVFPHYCCSLLYCSFPLITISHHCSAVVFRVGLRLGCSKAKRPQTIHKCFDKASESRFFHSLRFFILTLLFLPINSSLWFLFVVRWGLHNGRLLCDPCLDNNSNFNSSVYKCLIKRRSWYSLHLSHLCFPLLLGGFVCHYSVGRGHGYNQSPKHCSQYWWY